MGDTPTTTESTAAARSTTESTVGSWAHLLVAGAFGLHLLVNAIHGVAHAETGVSLGPAFDAVVLVAVVILPTTGIVLLWRGDRRRGDPLRGEHRRGDHRRGAAVFTVGMLASLALGAAFHFVLQTPDHVAHVPPGPWQEPFALTAVALLVTDSAGAAVGGALWWATTDGQPTPPRTGRIAGVPGTGFRPLARLLYRVSSRWFDEVPESLTVMAHHRGVLAGASAFELGLLRGDAVDDRLKALAVQKTAMEIGCPFCIDIGAAEARRLGISTAQLGALPAFDEADEFTVEETLVLRYAVAMTSTPTTVPDDLFDELEQTFDEAALVELTAAIAWENFRGRFNHALGIESQGFAE